MKKAAILLLALAMVPSLLLWPIGAAEAPPGTPSSSTGIETTPPAGNPTRSEKQERAIRPAGNATSAEVREMLNDFRDQQKTRLQEYRRLSAQARNATAEKRQQLREQLRQMIEEQKAERERLRDQIQERVQELKTNLPSRKDVIEAAKEKAREKQDRSRGE